MMQLKNADIISANQFDLPTLNRLFKFAHRMRRIETGEVRCNIFDGYTLGTFFFEESTRTRLSSERAFTLLGGRVSAMTDMKYSSLVKGESFEDCIRTLDHFCDVMVVRCKQKGQAAIAANIAQVPVINGGDGKGEHPTQALLDVFTISEERKGEINGLTIVMVGDMEHSRTVHSLVTLLTLFANITFIFVAPPALQLPPEYEALIKRRGHQIKKTSKLSQALPVADVIYMVRPQYERMNKQKKKIITNGHFCLNRKLVCSQCKEDVTIMHPLPRNKEIAPDVDELPQAAYFRAIENGILIRMALFTFIFGKEKKFV